MTYQQLYLIIGQMELQAQISFDKDFVKAVCLRFSNCCLDDNLSSEDMDWLRARVKSRWFEICDKPLHYSHNNKYWISIAKSVCDNDTSYINLLMPELTNTHCPTTLTPLNNLEPSDILIESGTKTGHNLTEILNRATKATSFYVYMGRYPDGVLRALSINELYQIRTKPVVETTSPWEIVTQSIFVKLSKQDAYPLPDLFYFVEQCDNYFEQKTYDFKHALDDWINRVKLLSVDRINSLYAKPISLDGDKVLLIDLILDCYGAQTADKLNVAVRRLATGLASIDPILIGKSANYPLITIYGLKDILNDLTAINERFFQPELQALINQIQLADDFTPNIISSVKSLFNARWLSIIDTPQDYFRPGVVSHCPWAKIAKKLSTNANFTRYYFSILVPSLKEDDAENNLMASPYIYEPMSHYVLSHTGTKLIPLLDTLVTYRDKHQFLCLSEDNRTLRQFHPIEVERLKYAPPKYWRFYLTHVIKPPNTSISMPTVQALKTLANRSSHRRGLDGVYEARQLTAAEHAWKDFFEFYQRLDDEERERLNALNVIIGDNEFNFKRDIVQALERNALCAAQIGQIIIQIVLNFEHSAIFDADVTTLGNLQLMRQNSSRQVYHEYAHITTEVAYRRLMTLMVSIMSYPFTQSVLTKSPTATIWDLSHEVSQVARNIFLALRNIYLNPDSTHARYIYVYVIEHILKAKPVSVSWWEQIYEYLGLSDNVWPQSIVSESIYQQTLCFEPEKLLWALSQPAIAQKHPSLNQQALQILQTLLQPEHEQYHFIRSNVLLHRLLWTLSSKEKWDILKNIQKVIAQCPLITKLSACKAYFNRGPQLSRYNFFADIIKLDEMRSLVAQVNTCQTMGQLTEFLSPYSGYTCIPLVAVKKDAPESSSSRMMYT